MAESKMMVIDKTDVKYQEGIMKITRWDIVEELATKEDVMGYLRVVFERNPSEDEICHALSVAIKAINAHGLVLDTGVQDTAVATMTA